MEIEENIDFNFIVTFGEEELCIKPPDSFDSLLDVVQEKFKTYQMAFTYVNDDLFLSTINSEEDYQKCIFYSTLKKLTCLVIFVAGSEKQNRRRTSSFRKIAKMAVSNNVTPYQLQESGGCQSEYNGDMGDLRNPKFNQEEYGSQKHSRNLNDKARVFYIKEKKEMLKEVQIEKEKEQKITKEKIKKEKETEFVVDPNFGKKKTKKKKRENDSD
jgi:hypothetical protein